MAPRGTDRLPRARESRAAVRRRGAAGGGSTATGGRLVLVVVAPAAAAGCRRVRVRRGRRCDFRAGRPGVRGRLRVAEHDAVEPDRAALRRALGLGGADAERRADGGAERGESLFVFLTPMCMHGGAECGKRPLVSCFSRPSRVFGVPREVKLESVVCWQSAAPSAQPTAADERVLPPAPTTPVFLFDGASRAAFSCPPIGRRAVGIPLCYFIHSGQQPILKRATSPQTRTTSSTSRGRGRPSSSTTRAWFRRLSSISSSQPQSTRVRRALARTAACENNDPRPSLRLPRPSLRLPRERARDAWGLGLVTIRGAHAASSLAASPALPDGGRHEPLASHERANATPPDDAGGAWRPHATLARHLSSRPPPRTQDTTPSPLARLARLRYGDGWESNEFTLFRVEVRSIE